VGVKFSEEALRRPPERQSAPSYLSELECERIGAKGCVVSCEREIEALRDNPDELARAHGRSAEDAEDPMWFARKSREVVGKEEELIEKCWEEIHEIDLRIMHLKRGLPFDVTRRSYALQPMWLREEDWNAETFRTQVECEQLFQVARGFPIVTPARLREALRVDREVLEVGQGDVPGDIDFFKEQVAGVARVQILAMVSEAARRNPSWWRRAKDLGPTPELVREAQQILNPPDQKCPIKSDARGVVRRAWRVRAAPRPRCSRARHGGRQRRNVASRSASRGGDSGDGDGGGGGSDPPGRCSSGAEGVGPLRAKCVAGAAR
jgi:hypothetical protein